MAKRVTLKDSFVVELFSDGYSVNDIAHRYSLTTQRVERIIRQALKAQVNP